MAAPEVNVDHHELYVVQGDYATVDLIVWQRYRRRAPGVVERTLEDNPHLSVAHRTSPFVPPGTFLRLPIDTSLLLRSKGTGVQLWSEKEGYSL